MLASRMLLVSCLTVPLKWTNAPIDMIHQYWNVRIAGKSLSSYQIDFTKRPLANSIGSDSDDARMRELMTRVEERGARIWEACSAFEELCATNISSMLLHASNGDYSEVALATSCFIANVDTIFRAIDAISRLVTPQVDWKGELPSQIIPTTVNVSLI